MDEKPVEVPEQNLQPRWDKSNYSPERGDEYEHLREVLGINALERFVYGDSHVDDPVSEDDEAPVHLTTAYARENSPLTMADLNEHVDGEDVYIKPTHISQVIPTVGAVQPVITEPVSSGEEFGQKKSEEAQDGEEKVEEVSSKPPKDTKTLPPEVKSQGQEDHGPSPSAEEGKSSISTSKVTPKSSSATKK